ALRLFGILDAVANRTTTAGCLDSEFVGCDHRIQCGHCSRNQWFNQRVLNRYNSPDFGSEWLLRTLNGVNDPHRKWVVPISAIRPTDLEALLTIPPKFLDGSPPVRLVYNLSIAKTRVFSCIQARDHRVRSIPTTLKPSRRAASVAVR